MSNVTREDINKRVTEITDVHGAGECWRARRRSLQAKLAIDFVEAIGYGTVNGDLVAASRLVLTGLLVGEEG